MVAMDSSDLPVCLKYKIVFSSTGNNPTVAPYYGAILLIVARSARVRDFTPEPKNSTNLSTTPFYLSIFVHRSTKSVAVA